MHISTYLPTYLSISLSISRSLSIDIYRYICVYFLYFRVHVSGLPQGRSFACPRRHYRRRHRISQSRFLPEMGRGRRTALLLCCLPGRGCEKPRNAHHSAADSAAIADAHVYDAHGVNRPRCPDYLHTHTAALQATAITLMLSPKTAYQQQHHGNSSIASLSERSVRSLRL
jgi:hypothetical protein